MRLVAFKGLADPPSASYVQLQFGDRSRRTAVTEGAQPAFREAITFPAFQPKDALSLRLFAADTHQLLGELQVDVEGPTAELQSKSLSLSGGVPGQVRPWESILGVR